MIVERCISTRNTLQTIVKIEHDLVQRELVDEHHTIFRHILEFSLHAALFVEQREYPAEECVVRKDGCLDERFFYLRYTTDVGHLRWGIDLLDHAVGGRHPITHTGRGRDQLEIKFSLEPLLDDLHVQQAEEAAAKSETEGRRRFGFEEKGRVVQT